MKYARIVDTQVIEVIETPAGFSIEQCLTPDLAIQCIPCPNEVAGNWSYVDGVFIPPASNILE